MRGPILISASVVAGLACVATALAQGATQDLAITATVARYCMIKGAAAPAALNTTIPVNSIGLVDTTLQTFTIADVACNGPTVVQAHSVKGGLKGSVKSGPLFTNIINYRGSATFGTAKSTVNTGAIKGAAGPEFGTTETTSGPTRGPMVITILPDQPPTPLMHGNDYEDTLRVTLTPTP
jgi:hypothetical protein